METKDDGILVGFEAAVYDSDGKLLNSDTVAQPVFLHLHHSAIFGMTQKSGKTTALEALISRARLRAIAFITKRGEAGFTKFTQIQPYYKPRADWQFVEGLVNVALGEKVKYEPGMRWAIIKVSKGSKSLHEVKEKAEKLLREAKKDWHRELFEKLITYLEIVVPELQKWIFSERLELSEGVNVMDLSGMRLETQQLVIASTIGYVFGNLDHVVVIIPEAWESIPQSKMTPIKWVAQQFIRKGAALGNYLLLDSQDIGGIDKTPLRQVDNWLMGRMKEAHEVERILKQLLGAKINAEDIQKLPLGHFYAALGNDVRKVYVLPAGVPESVGIEVAKGIRTPESVRDEFLKVMEVNEEVYKQKCKELEQNNRKLQEKVTGLERYAGQLASGENAEKLEKELGSLRTILEEEEQKNKEKDEEIQSLKDWRAGVKKKLDALDQISEGLTTILGNSPPASSRSTAPSEISVVTEQPALTIQTRTPPLTLDASSLEGKIAIVYAEGKLPTDKWFTTTDMVNAFAGHAWPRDPRTGPTLDKMCQWGFFEKHYSGRRPEYRVKLSPEDARGKGLIKEVEDFGSYS